MKRIASLLFVLAAVASLAGAAELGPRRGRPGGPIRSVAEPAGIVLLGAGLVSLGFYAKKKLGKKP